MIAKSFLLFSALLFSLTSGVSAQMKEVASLVIATASMSRPAALPESSPIQDNSFLIEEAYNQEPGVIQHINTMTRLWASTDWVYSFTEEWPVPGHAKNQVSYTVNVVSAGGSTGPGAGLGDSLVNYRYQLVGNGDTRLAISPRISLIAPIGHSALVRGYGATACKRIFQ